MSGDQDPGSISSSASLESPSFPSSLLPSDSPHSSSSSLTDTFGITQEGQKVSEPSRDSVQVEESLRALSLSKPADSALPPLASFFDVSSPGPALSGLEDEDLAGGDKQIEEPVIDGIADGVGSSPKNVPDDSSPLSPITDPPTIKPILNPSAMPFFSVNSGLGANPNEVAQDPLTIHTQPRVPLPQSTLLNPLQLQIQAMQQLPLSSQQQLLQFLVQNQLLLQQQALLQPSLALQSLAQGLPPLPIPLAPTPSLPRSPNAQELTFPPRTPPPPEQVELSPSVDLKLQKQREALARGGVTFPPKSLEPGLTPRSFNQELPISPPKDPTFPSAASIDLSQQKDFLRYLSPAPTPKSPSDLPAHFITPPPLNQVAVNVALAEGTSQARQSHSLSAEDSRQAFLQFQQWQKQQKQQGFDSSDMLRWVNEQAVHGTLPKEASPRPSLDQWQKSATDARFLPSVRVEHVQSPHPEYDQPRVSPRPEDLPVSPRNSVSRPIERLSASASMDRSAAEPWKPQLTIDPPESSWQKPQLTIDPPERVGELAIPSGRSRSREEQWQQRKHTLEPERGSISPATSPSRPGEWGQRQRTSFDSSDRGDLLSRSREDWPRHSHDSTGEPPLPLGRSRTGEAWDFAKKSIEDRHHEFMHKPRQSFDSTLDVPQAPMSVGRSRSTPTNLSKKMNSRFNFIPSEIQTPEESDETTTSTDPAAFQPPSITTLLNQELLRQGLLMQLSNLQAQQARQAMQAAMALPGADEATVNAAIAANSAAAQLAAQQQLQYYQTMSLRGQLDPAATTPSNFDLSSPLPSSPGGHDELSKSPRRGGSSLDKMKRTSQDRSRASSHSIGRRDGHSPPSPSPSPTNSSSVPWLEAFRAAKGMDQLSLKEVVVRGWLKDLATDQYGSRFLQRRLEAASQEHKHLAFDQLMQTGILPLCTDVFGNYVVQKFFDYSGPDHRAILATKLLGNVLQLSMQMYGCRVVQKAIELSEPPVQTQLVRELDGHVIECAEDQNGNHVIQKCLEKVTANKLDFMVEAFKGQIARLATHPYGCRVIQRLLERWGSEESIVSELLGEHTDELCRNQYGNYVIQHLLIHGSPWQRSGIIHALLGKLFVLSKHKFASNVVENCFVYGSPQDRTALIQEVLGRHPDESCLLSMVRDQYANYVVQKMIDLCDQDQLAMIVQRIKRHVPGLRKIPYGKNILTRLEKLTGTVFSGTTQLGSDAFPNSEMSSAATIPFPGTDNVSPSLHMNPWPSVVGHSPMNTRRAPDPGRFPRSMSSIGRDNSRDRGCPSFSGRRPLSIEADASGFSGLDEFDSYYAHLQSAPDGRDFEDM